MHSPLKYGDDSLFCPPMILRFFWLAMAAMAAAAFAHSPADDAADFNKARQYFVKDHKKSFARAAARISADSAYRPMLDYWSAVLELRRGRTDALEKLRADSESPYIRADAMRQLAEYYIAKNDRARFAAVAEVSPCGRLLADLYAQKSAAESAARKLWEAEQKFRDAICIAAFQQARADGFLREEDLWMKLRGFAGGGLLSTAKRFLRHFRIGISYGAVRKTVLRAKRYIRGKHSLATPADRALVMIAAMAAAKTDVDLAARRWRAFSRYFSAAENNQTWAKIGERAARAHRKDAMEFYRLAPDLTSGYDENARAWRVRAALRAKEYADIVRTVQQMPESESSLTAWRYWRAAALAKTGDRAESRKQMRALAAAADDYYGLLARESLGIPLAGVANFNETNLQPNAAQSAHANNGFAQTNLQTNAANSHFNFATARDDFATLQKMNLPSDFTTANANEMRGDIATPNLLRVNFANAIPKSNARTTKTDSDNLQLTLQTKLESQTESPNELQNDLQTELRDGAGGDFLLALALRRAGQTKLARRVWTHAMRNSPPEETLTAAAAAENEKWYLASINAADAAGAAAANPLRYPTPYNETIDKYSARFGLERAFVYALIRRESRFMPLAVSSARARGLMQVLPSTAKKVARRHGYGRYRLSRLTRVDTNVIIGATYLHDLAKQFGAHPAQIAAAYNAGPGRAVRWRKNIGDTMAMIENIPLRETRLYVKALLAARAHYALRFGAPQPSMHDLINRTILISQAAAN